MDPACLQLRQLHWLSSEVVEFRVVVDLSVQLRDPSTSEVVKVPLFRIVSGAISSELALPSAAAVAQTLLL